MYPFKEGSFAVKNGWYVAAFANEIGRRLVARTFLGEPVVLYRKENGEAVAVGGRCPHRHYPLGASCLRNDEIVCGYHGISFGPDGACTGIPSQAFVPKTYRIPTYPLVEHGIWLWIWMGDPEKADSSMLPNLEEIGAVSEATRAEPFYFYEIKCRYQLLNDNLLDLSHLAYLHQTSIGVPEHASVPDILTRRPGVLSSRRYMKGVSVTVEQGNVFGGINSIDRMSGMDFHVPGFHAGIDESWIPAPDPEGEPTLIMRGYVFHTVTPSTPTTCYYSFAMAAPVGIDLEQAKDALRPVVDEDIFASEEIEKMLQLVGASPKELMLKSDTNAVEGRRLLQSMMDAEAADAPEFTPVN